MRYLKIKHYIALLFSEGTDWEYREILKSSPTRRSSFWKRFLLLTISIILCYLLNKGFNDAFVGYVISALSIFIGLFTNIIIVLYQKFLSVENEIVQYTQGEQSGLVKPNDNRKLNFKKTKDFIRQFTFVTGKNLLIATIVILASTFTLLFKDFFSTDTNTYRIIASLQDVQSENIQRCISYLLIQAFRIGIVYLLLDFFVLLLYSLGGLFAFLKGEYSND